MCCSTFPTCCTGNRVLNDYFITDQPMTPVTPFPWKNSDLLILQTVSPMVPRFTARPGQLTAVFLPVTENCSFSEDIGRHNALDKAIGYALRHNIDLKNAWFIPVDVSHRYGDQGNPRQEYRFWQARHPLPSRQLPWPKNTHLTPLFCAARRDRMKLFTGNNPTE